MTAVLTTEELLDVWLPKPDITTFELALALPVLIVECRAFADTIGATAFAVVRHDLVVALPAEVQRHFGQTIPRH